jgi:hypothetical protein
MLRSDKDTAMLAGMAINWAQEFGAIPVRSPHDLWALLTPEQKPEEVEDAAITDATILPVINQAGPSLLCGLCVPRCAWRHSTQPCSNLLSRIYEVSNELLRLDRHDQGRPKVCFTARRSQSLSRHVLVALCCPLR